MKKSILRTKVIQILKKHKLSKKHSEICADYLIKAELVGAKSHGLTRLKMYCQRIQKKLKTQKSKLLEIKIEINKKMNKVSSICIFLITNNR